MLFTVDYRVISYYIHETSWSHCKYVFLCLFLSSCFHAVKGKWLKVRKNQKQFGRTVDSPKKQTNKFVLFAVKSKKANETNSFIHFFGEPTAHQSAFGFIWPLVEQPTIDSVSKANFKCPIKSKVANDRLCWAVFSTTKQPNTNPNLKLGSMKCLNRVNYINIYKARPCTITRRVIVRCVIYFH